MGSGGGSRLLVGGGGGSRLLVGGGSRLLVGGGGGSRLLVGGGSRLLVGGAAQSSFRRSEALGLRTASAEDPSSWTLPCHTPSPFLGTDGSCEKLNEDEPVMREGGRGGRGDE